LNILTPKMIGNRPNTYTYTKSIAEYLIKEECQNIPTAIFRPSIVGASLSESYPVSTVNTTRSPQSFAVPPL